VCHLENLALGGAILLPHCWAETLILHCWGESHRLFLPGLRWSFCRELAACVAPVVFQMKCLDHDLSQPLVRD
jgi:hypothetical protein